jgi:hypothetical protein
MLIYSDAPELGRHKSSGLRLATNPAVDPNADGSSCTYNELLMRVRGWCGGLVCRAKITLVQNGVSLLLYASQSWLKPVVGGAEMCRDNWKGAEVVNRVILLSDPTLAQVPRYGA